MSRYYCHPMYHQASTFYGYPVRHVNVIPQAYYYQQSMNRQFPTVDSTYFEKSAKSMQLLMREASLVLNKVAESGPFANKIMVAAQQSNMNEVERLIKSTGIKSKVDTTFNPDGINLKLSSKVEASDCCHLTIGLRWK